ncbi:hypothetical protein SLEP1_g56295 [Rubroshorea leprosula]|uniref:Wall-associated receptor kinase galacturonan-binding domain-containing protein n=1 Tax=Rubroshorea leprosula TaxID=152421 RepID=A0AAV5MHX5_9ROSI|nr:hypothetical protein SLEP1_g56295 [Rubroshorea leprosula]
MMIITRTSVFAFLQLLMIESAVGQALVKPGCKEHCGNVSIPYPFGIRADCYMHKGFEVSFSGTSNPPTNLLTSIETEMLYFSLDHSIFNVKIPIISQQCSVSLNFLDFSGSPFMSYKRRMLLLPEGCAPAVFDWVITDGDASQLPYRYDHAFNCSQFNDRVNIPPPQMRRATIRSQFGGVHDSGGARSSDHHLTQALKLGGKPLGHKAQFNNFNLLISLLSARKHYLLP